MVSVTFHKCLCQKLSEFAFLGALAVPQPAASASVINFEHVPGGIAGTSKRTLELAGFCFLSGEIIK